MGLFQDILKATLDWPPETDYSSSPKPKIETPYTALVRSFEQENWIGLGRHRAVFRRGRVVIKVPLSDWGELDNSREARAWRNLGRSDHLARCRLAGPLLVMEYVRHVGWNKNSPSWTNFVDCGQVGRTRKGLLVAYDYA